jgi:very-short-patch-repair endonuclease
MRAVRPDVVHMERAVAVLAGSQHGIVTRGQLEALGLTRAQIAHRIRKRALTAVHRGVYAVGHAAPSDDARVQAALMIGGGVASRWTAATLRALCPSMPAVLDVTITGRAPRGRAAVRFHETNAEPAWGWVRGMRVTTALQTLRDLDFPDRLTDEALARNLVHPSQIHRTPTRSELERTLERLLTAAGLPQPLINHRVGPYLLDFYWPEHRFAVEVDGRTHGWAGARKRDEARDRFLREKGVGVKRITTAELEHRPLRVVATLTRHLQT